MTLTETKRSRASLAEFVYDSLLRDIVSGDIGSGEILSEVSVAKRLGVSRTPVHDAIKRLVQDGLVERAVGRRARVARFSPDDMFEVLELRKYLEGPAVELAAGRMDERHLAPLRAMADEVARSMGNGGESAAWSTFEEALHRTVAAACGNRRLNQDILRYSLLHRGFCKLSTNPQRIERALSECYKILDALRDRDGQRAREAMVAHLSAWQDFFIRAMA